MRKEETLAAVWQSNLSNLPVRQSLHLCGGGPGGGGGLRRRARAHAAGVRSAEGPPPPVKSNLMFYLALKNCNHCERFKQAYDFDDIFQNLNLNRCKGVQIM